MSIGDPMVTQKLEQVPAILREMGIDAWLLASVQGLHRFYTSRMDDIGASWMTRQDRELAIADNIAYVDRVVQAIERDYQARDAFFLGFSQGVAMAFRAAVRGSVRALT